jgi:hypothetical protein
MFYITPPGASAVEPTFELLDTPYPSLARPLALVDGRAYAATWLYLRTTDPPRPPHRDRPVLPGHADGVDLVAKHSSTAVRALTPAIPNIHHLTPIAQPRISRALYVVRDDGHVFGPGADEPLASLELDVALADPPDDELLWRRPAVECYRRGERPDPADLFARLCAAYDAFVDFGRSLADQRTMCEVGACLSLATWLSDAFTLVPYLWLAGERGSGKTHLGTVWAQTAYLGLVVLAGGSYASLRDLAQHGAALYFDDAESFAGRRRGDSLKRELFLAGNRRGARVPIKTRVNGRWETRWSSAFTPRAFSAIAPPEPTLASRAIVIPLARTLDAGRSHRDPADPRAWPCDLASLRDDLWAFGLANLRHAADCWSQLDADPIVVGREFEKWRPVLAVARLLEFCGCSELESRLRALFHSYQAERMELPVQDDTIDLVRALIELAEDVIPGVLESIEHPRIPARLARHDVFMENEMIADAIARVVDRPIDPDDPRIMMRYAPILSRLRFRSVRQGHARTRGWMISLARLHELALAYGVPTRLAEMLAADTADTADTLICMKQTAQVSTSAGG